MERKDNIKYVVVGNRLTKGVLVEHYTDKKNAIFAENVRPGVPVVSRYRERSPELSRRQL